MWRITFWTKASGTLAFKSNAALLCLVSWKRSCLGIGFTHSFMEQYRVLVHREFLDEWKSLADRVGIENAQQFGTTSHTLPVSLHGSAPAA